MKSWFLAICTLIRRFYKTETELIFHLTQCSNLHRVASVLYHYGFVHVVLIFNLVT